MTGPVVRALLRYSAFLLLPAGGAAVGFTVSGFASHYGGVLDGSTWEGVGVVVRAAALGTGAMATPIMLPLLVAHGATRRRFAVAAGIVAALLAAAAGLYMAVGYLVERAVYAAADLPPALGSQHLFDSTGQPHLVVAEYALLWTVYLVGGWLAGTGYYGFGWWRGTACLLPGLLLVAAVEYLLATWWAGPALLPPELGLGHPDQPLAVVLGLAVAVTGLGLLAGRALIHPVAIRTRRLP